MYAHKALPAHFRTTGTVAPLSHRQYATIIWLASATMAADASSYVLPSILYFLALTNLMSTCFYMPNGCRYDHVRPSSTRSVRPLASNINATPNNNRNRNPSSASAAAPSAKSNSLPKPGTQMPPLKSRLNPNAVEFKPRATLVEQQRQAIIDEDFESKVSVPIGMDQLQFGMTEAAGMNFWLCVLYFQFTTFHRVLPLVQGRRRLAAINRVMRRLSENKRITMCCCRCCRPLPSIFCVLII